MEEALYYREKHFAKKKLRDTNRKLGVFESVDNKHLIDAAEKVANAVSANADKIATKDWIEHTQNNAEYRRDLKTVFDSIHKSHIRDWINADHVDDLAKLILTNDYDFRVQKFGSKTVGRGSGISKALDDDHWKSISKSERKKDGSWEQLFYRKKHWSSEKIRGANKKLGVFESSALLNSAENSMKNDDISSRNIFVHLFEAEHKCNLDWITLEQLIALIKMYATHEYDFTVKQMSDFDAEDSRTIDEKVLQNLQDEGWKIFENDGLNSQYVLYREKHWANEKIRNTNKKIGVFESTDMQDHLMDAAEKVAKLDKSLTKDWQDRQKLNKVWYRDLATVFDSIYKSHIRDWIDNDNLYDLAELILTNDYDFHVQKFSVKTVGRGIFSALIENQWKPMAENTGDRNGIREQLFYREKRWASDKIRDTNAQLGVFEHLKTFEGWKYYKDKEDKFDAVYNHMKNEFSKSFNAYVIDQLKLTGFDVEVGYNHGDSSCEMNVNGIPMHIVNRNQLCFDNERIYNSDEFDNMEVFRVLKKAGVDPVMGGPNFDNVRSLTRYFDETGLTVLTNPKLKHPVKLGIFDSE